MEAGDLWYARMYDHVCSLARARVFAHDLERYQAVDLLAALERKASGGQELAGYYLGIPWC